MPKEIILPQDESPLQVTYVERYNVWHGSYGTLDGSYQLQNAAASSTGAQTKQDGQV